VLPVKVWSLLVQILDILVSVLDEGESYLTTVYPEIGLDAYYKWFI